MTDHERMRVRAARYVPGSQYAGRVEQTLSALPPRQRVSRRDWRRTALIACAVLLLCALGLPPVVRAASPLIERLFSDIERRLDRRLSMTDDERFAQTLAEYESGTQIHDIDETAVFEGVQVRITEALFSSLGDPDVDDPNMGLLQMELTYDKIPPFDPNHMDFSLLYRGQTIPARPNENMPYYTETGIRAETTADWLNEEFQTVGNSKMVNGVPSTVLTFDLNPWRLTERTELVLRGVIMGRVLELPFVFDPDKAHENAVQYVRESMKYHVEEERQLKTDMAELDKRACKLGIVKQFGGKEYVLAQFAVMLDHPGEELVIGWSMHRESGPQPEFDQGWINDIYIDGMRVPGVRSGQLYNGEGECRMVNSAPLGRDPNRLPAESLIEMRIALNTSLANENEDPVVFRYNWKENTATLPKDAAEEAAWLAQSRQLIETLAARTPSQTVYDLQNSALAQEINGIKVTLTSMELSEGTVSIYYTLDCGPLPPGLRVAGLFSSTARPALTIAGRQAEEGGPVETDEAIGESFYLPIHHTEIGADTQLSFTLPVQLIDNTDKPIRTTTFTFHFNPPKR